MRVRSPAHSWRCDRTPGVRGGLADGLRCRPLASPYANKVGWVVGVSIVLKPEINGNWPI
jgi:hypothetical protein